MFNLAGKMEKGVLLIILAKNVYYQTFPRVKGVLSYTSVKGNIGWATLKGFFSNIYSHPKFKGSFHTSFQKLIVH
jgi:hypothetical protein